MNPTRTLAVTGVACHPCTATAAPDADGASPDEAGAELLPEAAQVGAALSRAVLAGFVVEETFAEVLHSPAPVRGDVRGNVCEEADHDGRLGAAAPGRASEAGRMW